MPPSKRHMLYLCADRGLPLGGTKGGSVHIRQFLDQLSGINWSATVLAANVEKELSGITADAVHTIPDILNYSFIDSALRLLNRGSQAKEAAEFLRNEQAAAAIARLHDKRPFEIIYERYSLFGMAGRSFAAQHDLPFVLEVNSPLLLEATKYRSLELTELAQTVEKYLFATSDQIVAVSEQVREYILSIAPAAEVTIIPNGFAPERFPERQEASAERSCLNMFSPEDIVVGFLGAVKPWHGVEELLTLFEQFQSEHESIKLAIVGNHKHLASYWKADPTGLIKNGSVVATGAVPFEIVPHYLSELDILVAPYPDLDDFYFSPLKVYEYMASGRPIIASAIGQIRDMLEDNVTALLIKPGDTEELQQAILRLKDDLVLRERLGQAARKEAFEKHSWQNRMELLEQKIQLLTDDRNRSRESHHAL